MTVFGHAELYDHTNLEEATASPQTSMKKHSTQKTGCDTARVENSIHVGIMESYLACAQGDTIRRCSAVKHVCQFLSP